jgi:hypothetical protein
MAVLYLCTSALGILLLVSPSFLGPAGNEPVMTIYGVILIAVSVPFSLLFAAAPFLPRRPWAWIVHLALIALGMTSACCIPACLPLLLFWIKPETKAMFERA